MSITKQEVSAANRLVRTKGSSQVGWVIGGDVYKEYIAAAHGNSNNVAEYLALIRLLETALKLPAPTDLQISGDSQLVILQLQGEWRIATEYIAALHAKASELIAELRAVGWMIALLWVERSRNTRADEASKSALIANGIEPAEQEPAPGYTSRFREMAEAHRISSIGFGRVLRELGLRNADGEPTPKALDEGLAGRRFDGFRYVFDWHQEKALAAVSAFLSDNILTAKFNIKRLQPKSDPTRARHLCGHEVAAGFRLRRRLSCK